MEVDVGEDLKRSEVSQETAVSRRGFGAISLAAGFAVVAGAWGAEAAERPLSETEVMRTAMRSWSPIRFTEPRKPRCSTTRKLQLRKSGGHGEAATANRATPSGGRGGEGCGRLCGVSRCPEGGRQNEEDWDARLLHGRFLGRE